MAQRKTPSPLTRANGRQPGGGAALVDPAGHIVSTPYDLFRDIIGAEAGINELTGDVTAGPGTGAQVATIADTAVTPGTYGSATKVGQFTVSSQGRITDAQDVTIAGAAGGIITTPQVIALDSVVVSGYALVVPEELEIADDTELEIEGGAIVEITGDAVPVLGIPHTIITDCDQSNNADTYVDDGELTFTVTAQAVYLIDLLVYFTTGTSNSVDVDFQFTIPSAATLTDVCYGLLSSATTAVALVWSSFFRTPAISGRGVISTATAPLTPVHIYGVLRIGATGGTVQFSFAQDVATAATPLVRKADSRLTYTRVK